MNDLTCPFCNRENLSILIENKLAMAFYDKYPVQNGHLLIIPKQHDKKYHPDGYNISRNIDYYGGQTILHLHFHLIPRYKGDIEKPRGGIRKMVKNIVQYP